MDYSGLKFAKVTRGERLRAEARADRDWQKKRDHCRYTVFTRAGGCCQYCGVRLVLLPSKARHEFEIANINEEPPRSNGGDPLNPRDCVCLCYKCHEDVTRNRLFIVFADPIEKANDVAGTTFTRTRPAA